MKIGIAQTDIKFEDKGYNKVKAKEMIYEAKRNNAELIVFPEMSFTGFSMNISITKESSFQTLDFMKECAIENRIAVAAGWVKTNDEKAENHYTIINENGLVISDYVKIHPFSYGGEDKYFVAGERINHIMYRKRHICTFICYDLRFPELFRSIVEDADIIIVAANWPASRENHWNTLLSARAIENQCYVIGVNCIGTQDRIQYKGGSCVINPMGSCLQYVREIESLFYVDIPDDVEVYRKQFSVIKDRKIELYKALLE